MVAWTWSTTTNVSKEKYLKVALASTLFDRKTTLMAWNQRWHNKKTVKTATVVCTQSTDSCLVWSLSDWLPWQGPWGGQSWRFFGPPPRHCSGHWGVQADQPGTPNQINHLSHEALVQSCCFPTVLYSYHLLENDFPIYFTCILESVSGSHITSADVCHCQISFHKLIFAD